jgi:hypothetical protein
MWLVGASFYAFALATNSGCSSDCTPAGSQHSKAVIDSITLPAAFSDFTLDLTGSGRPVNRLSFMLGRLAEFGAQPQPFQDKLLTSGQAVVLVDRISDTASTRDSDCVGTNVYQGLPNANPDFSGNGAFELDTSVPQANFAGQLKDSMFSSGNVFSSDNSIELILPIVFFEQAILVRLVASHIQYSIGASQTTTGQINGALTTSEIQTVIVPEIANGLTQRLSAGAMDTVGELITNEVDIGDGNGGCCSNSDGSTSCGKDGKIGACEVTHSTRLSEALMPDVRLFLDDGTTFHPVPQPQPLSADYNPDALSAGVGFAAVPASF